MRSRIFVLKCFWQYIEVLSGESTKFIGKQLCQSPFLNKVVGGRPIKKEIPTQCYLRTYTLLEIIENFREMFIFQIIGLFLPFMSCLVFIPWSQDMLMSPETERNSDSIDNVFMQGWTLQKLEIFYTLFLPLLFNQDFNILTVSKV